MQPTGPRRHNRLEMRWWRFIPLLVLACGRTGVPDRSDPVFVAAAGDDANPGTRELPKRTIGGALALGRRDVLVSAGLFEELGGLAVGSDVAIRGGFATDWRQYDPILHSVTLVVGSAGIAVTN